MLILLMVKLISYQKLMKTANEDKIEFATDIKNVENAVKVIKEVHPYEEPVINIIPLINDRFNLDF